MNVPDKISSIAAVHNLFQLKKPLHPLITVFDLDETTLIPETILHAVYTNFYVIAMKKDCAGECKYGQQYYDFEEGIMYFIAPNQVFQFEDVVSARVKGKVLIIRPDFLQGHPVSSVIKDYGYFSYSSHEALHLSEREERMVLEILDNIRNEMEIRMDAFTHDLIVSNIDLLLKYCDRFYNRQFLTRKKANNDLLSKLDNVLDDYFKSDRLAEGIPTVQFVAQELNFSPNYLSDMLRTYTGQTPQQHIQNRLIEKAKELLSTTGLSVSETAYQLGFEYPQSFHRLFKNQTSVSPVQFRESFNL